jgi:hypothetical protein
MFTLLDFRPQNRGLVIVISTISMCQNRSISLFFKFREAGANLIINPGVHFNNARWVLLYMQFRKSVQRYTNVLYATIPQFREHTH